MGYKDLSSMELDVLQEVGNIGAGHATTALSKLLNKKVDMNVPSVKVVSYDEMMELIGGPDEVVAAILFKVEGDIFSTVMFVFTLDEADSLVQKVIGDDDFSLAHDGPTNDLAFSALEEVGNIVVGTYLSALSDFTNIKLKQSVPHLGVDMAAAVLTYGLIEVSTESDYAIIIDTKLESQELEDPIKGNFFLLPEPNSLNILYDALGIEANE